MHCYKYRPLALEKFVIMDSMLCSIIQIVIHYHYLSSVYFSKKMKKEGGGTRCIEIEYLGYPEL
jgi:hypothetical protein